MAAYIKILSLILGPALLALIMDVGFDQRISELMGIPTTSLSPSDYRGITGLVLLVGTMMLMGLITYCRIMLAPNWGTATTAVAGAVSVISVLFLGLMLDFHARPQMFDVASKLVHKLGTPSIAQQVPVLEKSVETGAIPPPKKPPVAKKKPDPEPNFLTSPWAWLQWNSRKNQAECETYKDWKPQWCKNLPP